MMFHYNPYDQYTAMYATYSTTNVPTYSLQQTLLSLSDQQSLIHAQREQLAAEERKLNRLRAATLRRIRAQRLREAIEEAEIEDIVQNVFERERDGDRTMRQAVMYLHQSTVNRPVRANRLFREILNDARTRKVEQGLPADREIYRLLKIREMFDPSPRGPTIQFQRPFAQSQPQKYDAPKSPMEYEDTPVINEVAPDYFAPVQYFSEMPEVMSTLKRGSRRNSVRRDSQPVPEIRRTSIVTSAQTLQSFALLRNKFHSELASVPSTIRADVPPTVEEERMLQQHITRLEEILNEVDAVALPESAEELANTRRIRREIVMDIVAAIDGIERYTQPSTPIQDFAGAEADNSLHDSSDSEESAFIDMEIQRVIRETLARKKGEDIPRRSVTIEEVPDAEY